MCVNDKSKILRKRKITLPVSTSAKPLQDSVPPPSVADSHVLIDPPLPSFTIFVLIAEYSPSTSASELTPSLVPEIIADFSILP